MQITVDDPDFRLYVGDVHRVLGELPPRSIDCVVTSPPYWGLRDYAMPGQIGQEETPLAYVDALVAIFRLIRHRLVDTGTVWLNLGDTYNHDARLGVLKPKDLVGIPWRVALALQADGWWLRSDIIWHKPNVMPSSVTDRPTTTHEYVFLLAKQADYFFDQDAVRVPYVYDGRKKTTVTAGPGSLQHRDGERWPGLSRSAHDARKDSSRGGDETEPMEIPEGGRNIRTVWEIATINYAEAHFATFPPKLAELCIKAGCPEWVCLTCGEPREREVVTVSVREQRQSWSGEANAYGVRGGNHKGRTGNWGGEKEVQGWKPCSCATQPTTTSSSATSAATPGTSRTAPDGSTAPSSVPSVENSRPGTVLDPFMGSGTTALVARKLGRKSIGIELNPEYADLCARRLQQLSLFG